ncbi:MAG: hypothetical protein MJ077_11480 [Oscillospiraceae bacterium]|nr:hypothetical protein [Oscillospiraceae bacterium]
MEKCVGILPPLCFHLLGDLPDCRQQLIGVLCQRFAQHGQSFHRIEIGDETKILLHQIILCEDAASGVQHIFKARRRQRGKSDTEVVIVQIFQKTTRHTGFQQF